MSSLYRLDKSNMVDRKDDCQLIFQQQPLVHVCKFVLFEHIFIKHGFTVVHSYVD
jgi:hypothetical protein